MQDAGGASGHLKQVAQIVREQAHQGKLTEDGVVSGDGKEEKVTKRQARGTQRSKGP